MSAIVLHYDFLKRVNYILLI